MRVATINIPRSVGADAWAACWTAAADHAPIFGVNESLTTAQRRTYAALAGERGYGIAALWSSPNPIFFDAALYGLLSVRVVGLHGPGRSVLARRWPGYNAARSATVAVLAEYHGGRVHTVICTHWVPEGTRVPAGWRTWARARSVARVAALVASQRRRGRIVWLLGDLNTKGRVRLGVKRFRWLRVEGVDKIGVAVPLGIRASRGRHTLFPAPTDHRHGAVGHVRLDRA